MKVVIKEPAGKPYVRNVKNELKTFQDIVGGHIEHVAYETPAGTVGLICNEGGKILGLDECIPVVDDSGTFIADVVVGTVAVVGTDIEEGEFIDLTTEQTEYLLKDLSEKSIKDRFERCIRLA